MSKNVQHLKPQSAGQDADPFLADRAQFELYQAFMVGYVRRLNEATFNVTIGGVRIGSAKYSRLAQINLQSRIITFSRFAVENVPERGRRYLVLHELAHVKEATHNKHFWGLVERYEPDYRRVSQKLELAFRSNVKEDVRRLKKLNASEQLSERLAEAKASLSKRLLNYKLDTGKTKETPGYGKLLLPASAEAHRHEAEQDAAGAIADPFRYECEQDPPGGEDSFVGRDDECAGWDDDALLGTVYGGCLD